MSTRTSASALAFALTLSVAAVHCGSSGSAPENPDGGAGGSSSGGGSSSSGGAGGSSSGAASSSSGSSSGAQTSSGSSGSSSGAVADAGAQDGSAALPDGSLLVEFVKTDETASFDKNQEENSTGTIAFGVANTSADDGLVGTLTRTGGQSTIGTGGAVEIVSNRTFSFGEFRFRFDLASCATSEELVNGVFSYFNDGTKAADGLVINREVDIEILCGEPWFINLTIWTEYTDDTHLQNQARVLDTRDGTLYVYANDSEGTETGTESHPELKIPGFPVAGTFYEMGWTWEPSSLTYFIVSGGTQLTMWQATDVTRIPQLPMEQHFNVWAPGDHWSTGDKAGAPANDATLTLDWFRYEPK